MNRVITELAVFDVDPEKGLTLIEILTDITMEELTAKTEAPFQVSKDLKTVLQRK